MNYLHPKNRKVRPEAIASGHGVANWKHACVLPKNISTIGEGPENLLTYKLQYEILGRQKYVTSDSGTRGRNRPERYQCSSVNRSGKLHTTYKLRMEDISMSEELRNTMAHPLRVEDVSIEWAVEKHDDAPPKSRRCEHWVSSWKTRWRTC